MQISGTSGSSPAWAVREHFPPPDDSTQNVQGARQQMPGNGGCAPSQGVGGAQISSQMLSQLLNMQSGSGGGHASGAADAASKMISSLDTNGDGVVSLEEATAGGSDRATEAFAALDSDGDGSLTSEELQTSLAQMGPPPGGRPHGPPPGLSSSDIASQILSTADADDDGGLSLGEVTNATGTGQSEATSQAFSSLDKDGDGKLSMAELTAALDKYLQTNASSFADGEAQAIAA